MEMDPLLLVPHDARDFFVREFGVDAPVWGPRLAFLFPWQLGPWKPQHRRAVQELDAIEPALKAIKKASKALNKCPRGGHVDQNSGTSVEEMNQAMSDAIRMLEEAKDYLRLVRQATAPV